MSKYPISPLSFRVLLRPRKFEEKTKGGIIKVSGSTEARRHTVGIYEARVLELGPAAGKFFEREYNAPWEVKVGSFVLFKQNLGLRWRLNDDEENEEYVIINDEDIMCTIDPSVIEENQYA